MDRLLDSINDNIVNCNNFKCGNHSHIIMNNLDDVIKCMIDASNLCIPKVKVKINNNAMPGWNEYVKTYKHASIMWTNIWKDSGCPQTGELAKIRRHTRMKYHSAIRYIKKNKDYLIKYETDNSLLNK